ncbi:MAG TPA: SGNH/GDSL hydrolase family protein [Nocardioidaceae bacterium]
MRLAAAAVACALLVGGCSSEADPVEDVQRQAADLADASTPSYDRYVALGDSFTAAPLVPTTDLAGGCFRSDGNYPSLVAERLDVDELVDVSCSGARTRDLTRRQQTVRDATVPPQLRAVDRDTDLVTLGIGGNDFDLFRTLVATCSQLGGRDRSGSPCAEELERRGVDLVERTGEISTRVERSVEQIRERAPEARVVLVGYLRLAPEEGACRDLPFAEGDYGFGLTVSEALNDALEEAADRTGAEFVDMHAASEGHDVCADEPWVNGHRTVQDEALAYHPFAEGMEAVADEVVATLE